MAIFRRAAAAAFLSCCSSVTAQFEFGTGACPCIDPWAATSFATAEATAAFSADQCRSASHAGRNRDGPTISCLAADYGASRCHTWDQLLSPECVNAQGEVPDSGQPDWCQSSWCYVDPDSCDRPFSTSTMSWPGVTGLPDDGLAYSYETCGNVDSYSASKHYEVLKGQHLRVSYPGDSSTGYTLFTKESGRKDGSFVKFMQDIAAEAEFTWEVHNISEASKSRFSSSYTACVHEVALGETDLCIGNFWMTSQRLLLSSFGPNIYNDEFRLIVLAEDSIDWLTLMGTPFKPFTSTAWWAIAGLVMYMSCALYLMEPDEIDIDDISFLDRFTDVIGIQNDRYWWLATLDNVMTFGAKCTYFGVTAFTSGAPVQEASNFPSRVISAGFATFGLIILTAYTASSAAALVADASSGSINSIDDVIAMGATVKVCVRTAMAESMQQRYPTVSLLGRDQVDEMIDDLEAGRCVAAVVMSDAWDRQLVANSENCKKRKVGATLITQGNAVPIADKYQMPMSYLIARHLASGNYHVLRDEYRNEYVGVADCSAETAAKSSDGFQQLDHMNLLAPLVLTFVCTTIGLLVFFACGYSGFGDGVITGSAVDKQLHKDLQKLPLSELRARAMKVSSGADTEEERDEAINAASFGETGPLVEFVFDAECSRERKVHVAIHKLTLVEMLDKATEMGVPQADVDAAVDDKLEPRDRLAAVLESAVLAGKDEETNPSFEAEAADSAVIT